MTTTAADPYSRIERDSEHEYRRDTRPVPGVTMLLKRAGYVEDYGHVPPDVMAVASERGRTVHLVTALYDQSKLDPDSVRDDIRPYLNAWIEFRRVHYFEPRLIERLVYCPEYNYAGQLDRLGSTDRYRNVLVDIKTTAALPAHVGPQTAAYAMACRMSKLSPVNARLCVHLKRDGTYGLHPQRSPNDWAVFHDALVQYNPTRTRRHREWLNQQPIKP